MKKSRTKVAIYNRSSQDNGGNVMDNNNSKGSGVLSQTDYSSATVLSTATRVFDIVSLLVLPAPDDHRIRPEYMRAKDDPHQNGIAGKVVADGFLSWY
jgi:hypothetical protein